MMVLSIGFLFSSVSRLGGGVSEAGRHLAAALAERGHNVQVTGLVDRFTEEDREGWTPVTPQPFEIRGPERFGYAPGLLSKLEEANLDLLHSHGLWMYPSHAAGRWHRAGRAHIVSAHGMLDPWALTRSKVVKRLAAAIFERKHLASADCLHALNAAEVEAMRAYGVEQSICVIPNGVPIPEEPECETERTATLLYLGRLHPKKGIEELIKGWARARRSAGPTARAWRLRIAGWGNEGHTSRLKELSQSLSLGRSISFDGPLYGAAKEAAFREASAFVLPSKSEGLPVTVLEAWSYRVPALITPACNLPEGLARGAAIAIRPDPESIARGILTLLEMSPNERSVRGTSGHELVLRAYTWPRVAERMEQVYTWLLNGGDAPSFVDIETP